MIDSLLPADIEHTCSTYGVGVVSDITYLPESQQWAFLGVNYKEAESKPRNYVAFREEGYPGIRIRQVRHRYSD